MAEGLMGLYSKRWSLRPKMTILGRKTNLIQTWGNKTIFFLDYIYIYIYIYISFFFVEDLNLMIMENIKEIERGRENDG